jgi:hypothetical protein
MPAFGLIPMSCRIIGVVVFLAVLSGRRWSGAFRIGVMAGNWRNRQRATNYRHHRCPEPWTDCLASLSGLYQSPRSLTF